jgi:two-component system chemotaxis response regulator CheB
VENNTSQVDDGLRGGVAVGGSAGAVEAITPVAAGLPADLPFAILVAVHMPPGGVSTLAHRGSQWPVARTSSAGG